MVGDTQKLRQQSNRILDEIPRINDPQMQHQLAAKAFEIAQLAEAIDRLNLRVARDSKIRQLFEQLHKAMDHDQREISQRLLIQEQNLYALSQERLDNLYHLFVDCADRVSSLTTLLNQKRNRANFVNGDELLLENLVGMQTLFENLLSNELTRQKQNL